MTLQKINLLAINYCLNWIDGFFKSWKFEKGKTKTDKQSDIKKEKLSIERVREK